MTMNFSRKFIPCGMQNRKKINLLSLLNDNHHADILPISVLVNFPGNVESNVSIQQLIPKLMLLTSELPFGGAPVVPTNNKVF